MKADDAINRQAAINVAVDAVDDWDGGCNKTREEYIRKALETLPPVKPTEKVEPCEDAISRQAVLDLPKNTERGFGGKILEQSINIEYIKALPPVTAEKPNKWIPVSERLPEAGEYVGDVAKYYLVQNEYGDMLVARYTHGEYWEQIYQLKPIGDEIVAWMPLPEPYKASPTGAERER